MSWAKRYTRGRERWLFYVALFVVFVVLKLAEVGSMSDCPWLWVTCPLWIPWAVHAFLLAILLVVLAVTAVATIITAWLVHRKANQ